MGPERSTCPPASCKGTDVRWLLTAKMADDMIHLKGRIPQVLRKWEPTLIGSSRVPIGIPCLHLKKKKKKKTHPGWERNPHFDDVKRNVLVASIVFTSVQFCTAFLKVRMVGPKNAESQM